MTNRLAPIIAQKKHEIAALYALVHAQPDHEIARVLHGHIERKIGQCFKHVLHGSSLRVIAEIKRKSPSKGTLAPIKDPVALAQTYVAGGADALSILTDELFFAGKIADLHNVVQAQLATPILRKDFVLNAIQIAEAVAAGADAILAIVAILGEETKTIIAAAKAMGIDVLVEVHTEAELEIALRSGAEIVGVNNRDLSTFQVDMERAYQIVRHIPLGIVCVAESGIMQPELALEYHQAGFDAVLVGEALVTTADPAQFIRACHG